MNSIDKDGRTALMWSAKAGYYQCVESLIKAEADVNVISQRDETALFAAASYRDKTSVKEILKAGVHLRGTKILNDQSPFNPCGFISDETSLLLMAAGERTWIDYKIADFLAQCRTPTEELNLKRLCRKSIRGLLLKLGQPVNLFVKISQLGLPSSLEKYLTFDALLE